MKSRTNVYVLTFRFGQLLAIVNTDSSVINVPPIFRCCKEAAREICGKEVYQLIEAKQYFSTNKSIQITYVPNV